MEGEGPALIQGAEAGNEFAQAAIDRLGVELQFDYHWLAFQELSTERQYGMSIGPIPVSFIKARIAEDRLNAAEASTFLYAIRALDNHFINKVREATNKASKSNR